MRPSNLPGPLTLLPVARSPSRPRYRTSLVGSYPTLSPLTRFPMGSLAGLLSVAVVVKLQLLAACPHLLFREATVSLSGPGVGKFLCPILVDSDGSPHLRQSHRFLKALHPLHARRPRQDSNLRPQRPQRCALSPELRGRNAENLPFSVEDYSTVPASCQSLAFLFWETLDRPNAD
jgi:hypothetical protein